MFRGKTRIARVTAVVREGYYDWRTKSWTGRILKLDIDPRSDRKHHLMFLHNEWNEKYLVVHRKHRTVTVSSGAKQTMAVGLSDHGEGSSLPLQ